MGNVENTPYASLGSALRSMRLRQKESILEVSSAVEVTGERLALFENGELRPSEDVLELLIAHYQLTDKEADKLWSLAGYKKGEDMTDQPQQSQQNIYVMPFDVRVIYTDLVQVNVTDQGVVVNFMQMNGPNSQPLAISRVGMSREHAKNVIALLEESLAKAEAEKNPKRLDSSQENTQSNT